MTPRLRTARLDLLAAGVEDLEAELASAAMLAARLDVHVPPDWPPGEYDHAAMRMFRDRLRAEGEASAGWYGWYACERPAAGGTADLVGACGFFGPPGADGVTEIGYSVAQGARGRGIATEMVGALVLRAFATPGVTSVQAETRDDNVGSQRVLERNGFRPAGPGRDPGYRRWRIARSSEAT